MNKRRKLLIALGAGALAAPFGTVAQQQGKVWRVGVLANLSRPASIESHFYGGFLRGMRELGYVEGNNLVIEWRFSDGKTERLPGLAAELVNLAVDVVLATSSPATGAAQKAIVNIPIVMASVGDPVGSGFVKTLARPGGNITGLSNLNVDISPKLMEMLHSMVPKLARIAVLVNPDNAFHATSLKSIHAEAKRKGIAALSFEARTPQEIEIAFSQMVGQKAGALVVGGDPLYNQQSRQIVQLATKYRLPSTAALWEYAESGGLMSYQANSADQYRRAATYVDRIFKGAKPADLPVEQPTKFELIINRKTAKALGLTIPQSLLIRSDKVIE